MAALVWDEQAQAWTEPEIPLVYDKESGAFVDTTGLVWDADAQAWVESWGQKVSAYVYGAVSETVTIKKDGIIIATVPTGQSGRSAEKITLSCGVYTLTGSVSGWTEEQTVDRNTIKFRAMPEGSLYWYGNGYGNFVKYKSNSNDVIVNTNNFILPERLRTTDNYYLHLIIAMNVSDFSKICVMETGGWFYLSEYNSGVKAFLDSGNSPSRANNYCLGGVVIKNNEGLIEYQIKGNGLEYVSASNNISNGNATVYAIWLE